MTTPFEAKGWKATDKFRVVANKTVHDYNIGTVVKLCWDDETNQPEFADNNGYRCYCDIDTDLERIEPEWNGEGLPPVGTVCERFRPCGDWVECTVIFVGSQVIVTQEACHEISFDIDDVQFRLIRSERDKAVDDMIKLFVDNNEDTTRKAIEALYDAGYRKV